MVDDSMTRMYSVQQDYAQHTDNNSEDHSWEGIICYSPTPVIHYSLAGVDPTNNSKLRGYMIAHSMIANSGDHTD
ncbi:hypothetical protein G9A89_000295 [Geosiphon pyriformis]|nr:hypothetical protein G9A89_000295 [Geosiphon pyriformis]